MTNADAVRDGLRAVFGNYSENIHIETNVIKVNFFYGKTTEDPVSWLSAFNCAVATNRWANERKVNIVSGYLRGEAAEWFELRRADIVAHWDTASNSGNNFTD